MVSGSATVIDDLTVGGKITAQEFQMEYINTTVIQESGSTIFGDSLDDTHLYTGSLDITGSVTASALVVPEGQL